MKRNIKKVLVIVNKALICAALSDFLFLTQLEKLLIRLNLQSAVIDYESLDYNIHCRCNCPLYVMLEGTHTFLLVSIVKIGAHVVAFKSKYKPKKIAQK